MDSSIFFLRSLENKNECEILQEFIIFKCQNVYILLLCQIVEVLGASETITNEVKMKK